MNETMIEDILLTCLNPSLTDHQRSLLSELESAEWEELIVLANTQRVMPLLYHHIKSHHLSELLPAHLMKQLYTAFRGNAIRNLKIYNDTAQILKRLQTKNIPALVLKGAYLAKTVYREPALRFMIDVDIMVQEADLPAAIELITGLGYQSKQPIRLESKAVLHHLPAFFKENGTASLELHWTITQPNRPYTIQKVDELWTRAQPFTLGSIKALTLSPEDLLLHLCVHAAYHHQFKIGVRPLYDIAQTVTHFQTELDWNTVYQRSIEWGCVRGVYLILHLSNMLLGAAIPSHVLNRFKPVELPNELVESAKAYLFMPDDESDENISDNVMRMVGERPLKDKAKLLYKRLFISRQELANAYGVEVDSPRLYLYYPVRFTDFLRNSSQQMWHYLSGQTEFKRDADQRNRLVNWMEQI